MRSVARLNWEGISSSATLAALSTRAYNSCRNRHCPKCQSLAKAKWLEKQTSELLPVGYFHLVFTLPHEFNRLILAHKKIGLSLLFKAVSETLLEFGQTTS